MVKAQAFDPYEYFGAVEMQIMPDEDYIEDRVLP